MRDQILDLVKENLPDIDFEASDSLVDDGILDSVSLVEVITALSMEFGVDIPYEEIIPENFNSLEAMAAMVERLQA